MLAETGKYGQITIRRIYGDWTTSNMNGWKDAINNVAFQPIQQFRNTIGKNATDSAMIIDAMDILHSGWVDGFCIVSSDSDYTRLATRIREKGVFVMGIGQQKTPKAFEMAVTEDGWAHLGEFGSRLLQLDPGFDPRTYGYKQLSQLIKAYQNIFEIKSNQNEKGPTILYVKLRMLFLQQNFQIILT
ncbi:MAG: NYN domain-containing protein [Candidatus Methanoperedens sp.]|nr:NYN domain-containing protein [Candidatus Methanoperedens sp.]